MSENLLHLYKHLKCKSHIIPIISAADRLAGEERNTVTTKCVNTCVKKLAKKDAENSARKNRNSNWLRFMSICEKTSCMYVWYVCAVPVFGVDPETLSKHFILAVFDG